MVYRAIDTSPICAGLDRQPELEREATSGNVARYTWIDLDRGLSRATIVVESGKVQVKAQTRENLAEARGFLETCLRGLIQPIAELGGEIPPLVGSIQPGSDHGLSGTAFLTRVLHRWPDAPSPLLNGRAPREACRSQSGRQRVAALLLGLERDFARLKRLGRPWADITPLREELGLPPPTP
jgi:hypothetical protein